MCDWLCFSDRTWFKPPRPPRTETRGFGGQNKEKDGNEDGYCGVRHKPEIVASDERLKYDFLMISLQKCQKKLYVYKLCFGVESMCCPAGDEARIPCEPHHHQENKETQDADLSKWHGAQQAVLLTDHIIGSDVFLCLHCPAAPRLLQARAKQNQNLPMSRHFVDVIRV